MRIWYGYGEDEYTDYPETEVDSFLRETDGSDDDMAAREAETEAYIEDAPDWYLAIM